MTDDGRLLDLLTEVLDAYPKAAPDRLVAVVLDGVRTAPQRARWRSPRGWLRFIPDVFARGPAAAWVVVFVLAATALLVVQLAPHAGIGGHGSPSPSPVRSPGASTAPSGSPSASSPPSAFDRTQVAIESTGSGGLVSGVAYTSSAFQPQVAFRLLALGQRPGTGQSTDWCSAATSPGEIVLPWKMACVSDLRILHPFAVDCGTPDTHPDAASLAAAILAKPGMGIVHDRGTLQTPGALPTSLFSARYPGRVLEIIRSRNLDPKATDPDHCRLLPEPGSSDPTIELRGDLSAMLILVDVNGELVVIRGGSAGYDGPTAAAGEARGYGNVEVLDAMLDAIQDIEFR